MSEPTPPRVPVRPITPLHVSAPGGDEKGSRERCSGERYHRMHAVWRCPVYSSKTDYCGW